jgi:hypothetical protein
VPIVVVADATPARSKEYPTPAWLRLKSSHSHRVVCTTLSNIQDLLPAAEDVVVRTPQCFCYHYRTIASTNFLLFDRIVGKGARLDHSQLFRIGLQPGDPAVTRLIKWSSGPFPEKAEKILKLLLDLPL